jgi:hypothetical protein
VKRRYEIEISNERYHDWNVTVTRTDTKKPKVIADGLGPHRTAEVLTVIGDLLDDLPSEAKP